MTEPLNPCQHLAITVYTNADYPDATMWGCSDCDIRFYPHHNAARSAAAKTARLRAEELERALREIALFADNRQDAWHDHPDDLRKIAAEARRVLEGETP